MATWKLSNRYEKNIVEVQPFTKNNVKASKAQCYGWGTWTCQSDTKPNIDLANPNGFDPATGENTWTLSTLQDKVWINWGIVPEMDPMQRQAIKTLWETGGDQGMVNDGYAKGTPTYKLYGGLKLVNQDTGEQWFGGEI